MKKIFAINLGSASTNVAYYEDETCVCKDNISHPVEAIKACHSIAAQCVHPIPCG